MEISSRGLITQIHGMLFGAFFLLAVFAVAVELWRTVYETEPRVLSGDRSLDGTPLPYWHCGDRVGCGADGRVHCLSVVSRNSARGRRQSCPVPPSPFEVEPDHCRLALFRHGVERACCLVCPNRHDHGCLRVNQVRNVDQEASPTPQCPVSFCSRRILRRGCGRLLRR